MTLRSWTQAKEVACSKNSQGQEDFVLYYNASKIEGSIYLEFRDFKNAIRVYKRLKNYCDDKKRYKEKIVCYGQLGHVFSIIDE